MPAITYGERQGAAPSCGAYALTAIGQAFARLPGGWTRATTEALYQRLKDPGFHNYCMPPTIVEVASEWDLSVSVKGVPALCDVLAVHEKEKAIFGNPTRSEYSAPADQEAQMICVLAQDPRHYTPVFHTPIHWLARGSDGKYYDSKDGDCTHAWGEPGEFQDRLGDSPYCWSGLWMVFRFPVRDQFGRARLSGRAARRRE